MPRLSVDLDLVFTDHRLPRDAALSRINGAIRQCAARLTARGFQTHAFAAPEAGETKLLVRRAGIEVKVEVHFVVRGTVHPVRMAALGQVHHKPSDPLRTCAERKARNSTPLVEVHRYITTQSAPRCWATAKARFTALSTDDSCAAPVGLAPHWPEVN